MIESDNDTPDTDESDIEDVDFMNDKIGSEQRRIRHREKLEEDKNRKIESRRTWLLKQIKNCERKETVRILWKISSKCRFISGSFWFSDFRALRRLTPISTQFRNSIIGTYGVGTAYTVISH